MSDLYPLAIWGELLDGDLAAIKAAKAQLDVGFLVAPVPAVPGGPVRVLALRSAPDFFCDYALVADPQNGPGLLAALRWVLDTTMEDDRATLAIDWLRSIFGEGVREMVDIPSSWPVFE